MISFRSELTKRLLNYLFINPYEKLYVNELSRNLKLDKRNLVKKLKELEKEGILESDFRGNLKFYSINKKYPLYKEYKKIMFKTLGFEGELKKVLRDIKDVIAVYLYGSYAKDKMDAHSDIDLLVIGNHDIKILQKGITKIQKEIGREINVISMAPIEYKKRIAKKDPFITGVLKKKYIKLL